jgi:DNA polymerase III epsilon subunit-like protein
MQPVIEQFRLNISRVRDLVAIYSILENQTAGRLVFSDILRAAFVLAVSALDYYVHEVVRIGMLEIYRGQRPETSAFSRFQISLSSLRRALNETADNEYLLENEIRQRHSYQSFQRPDKIADAIRLISDKQVWKEVSVKMGITDQNIKEQLRIIVERRDQIAHEADIDRNRLDTRCPINQVFVSEKVDFLEQVVESIHKIL